MKRWKQWAATVAALTVLATVTACTANSPDPFGGGKKESGLTAEQAMAGASEQVQTVYKQNCLSCHASNLEGRMGPKTNLQQVGGRMTKEQIVKQIEQGGGGMPGFQGKLKPEETAALAEWLASKK